MRSVYSREYQLLIKRLRQARHEANLRQEDAAKRLGYNQTFVSKIERGERRLDPIELLKFARVYNKSIFYFLPAAKKLPS